MYRKITFVLALFTFSLLFAQSANLDRGYFKVSYVNLPSNPILDHSKRTYSSNHKSIILNGFSKVKSSGSLGIDFSYYGTIIGEVDIKKNKHEKKDKEGNVTSVTYSYKVFIPFTSSAGINITNAINPQEGYQDDFSKKDIHDSESFSSYSSAKSYYDDNKNNLRREYTLKHKSDFINSINSILDNRYGYSVVNKIDQFWILGNKKHPEFQKHNEALDKMKTSFSKMASDLPVDELKNELKPIIEYFDAVVPNYVGDKKKMKKVRYATYYNNAKMYYYLDMPEKSKIYANKLINNDYSKSDGKYINRISNELIERFKANRTNSRHFKIETRSSVQEEKKEVSLSEKEAKAPVIEPFTNQYSTFYKSNGDTKSDNSIVLMALKTMKDVFAATGNFLGFYPLDNDLIIDKNSKKIMGKKFIVPNNSQAYKTISFKWKDNLLTHADIDSTKIDLYWKENHITRIKINGYGNFDYSINYDAQNNPTTLKPNIPNMKWDDAIYKLNYKGDKLVSSKLEVQTLIKNYVMKHKTFLYEKDRIAINEVFKKNKTKEIRNDSIYISRISDQEVEVTYKWNKDSSSKTKNYYKYRPDGQHLQRIKISYDRNTKEVHDNFFKDNKIVRTIITSTKNGISYEKTIVNSKHLEKKPEHTKDYQWRHGVYKFDKDGILIFEKRKGKYREKINGYWTDWKYIHY